LGTKITLSYCLLFFSAIGIAQNRKQIHGKISVLDGSPSGVLILNLNTEQESKSAMDGSFMILAKADDVLLFSAEHLDYMRKIIENENYLQQTLQIQMTSKGVVLDEVEIIDTKKYNAVDLGILQKPAKRYTPAERKLYTAGDFKPIHLLAIIGGGMPLDPVFNAINGKTKRLKKEITLERNALRLKEFYTFYSEEELIDKLKINPDELNEFVYFVLEEETFKMLLENKEKSKMTFYLIQKHSEFKIENTSDEK
jgi:hypothetical protein